MCGNKLQFIVGLLLLCPPTNSRRGMHTPLHYKSKLQKFYLTIHTSLVSCHGFGALISRHSLMDISSTSLIILFCSYPMYVFQPGMEICTKYLFDQGY